MIDIRHLLRDLRVSELERVTAFERQIAEAGVPPHLVNAIIYRCGFVEGRKEERRRQDERKHHADRQRALLAVRQELETTEATPVPITFEEATPNE